MEDSGISWTHHTFNPWIGCQKVSEACRNCYAARDVKRYGGDFFGRRVMTSDAYWQKPIIWDKSRRLGDERFRVFCASWADVFEDTEIPIFNSKDQPGWIDHDGKIAFGELHQLPISVLTARRLQTDDLVQRLFALIDATPNLLWMLLTKRPENILRKIPCRVNPTLGCSECTPSFPRRREPTPGNHRCKFRANIALGVTAENQEQAAERISKLHQCRHVAPIRFVSCEPLLGPINLFSTFGYEDKVQIHPETPNLNPAFRVSNETRYLMEAVQWVIAGGESGPGARPSRLDWFRSLRKQCDAFRVPFHFKQWGEWISGINFGRDDGTYNETSIGIFKESKYETHFWDVDAQHEEDVSVRVGTKQSGRLLDGVVHDAFPAWALDGCSR